MSEWVETPLGKLVSFKKGKKVETSDLALDGFLPYLGASSLTGGEDGFALPNGGISCVASDALMLWDGERSGLVGPGKSGVISSTVMRLRPEAEMTGRYLVHCLRDRFEWIQARRTGTGVPHVPKDLGRILELRFPESELEQSAICNILDALDTQIEATEGLIAKQERVRAGLMQDLFTRGVDEHGQLRPPRHQAPHLYHQTKLGWLPVGWEALSFEKLVDPNRPISYGILMPGQHVHDGVPVVKVRDIRGGEIMQRGLLRTSRKIDAEYARSRLKENDLLITIRGTVGRTAVVPAELAGANITQDTARLAIAHGTSDFFREYLSSHAAAIYLQNNTLGQAVQGINLRDVKSMLAPSPSKCEQSEIAASLKSYRRFLSMLTAELQGLRLLKYGLMQDLLTGKVSVTPLLEAVPA
jgi:type I restriction enzyme S subunit